MKGNVHYGVPLDFTVTCEINIVLKRTFRPEECLQEDCSLQEYYFNILKQISAI